MTTVFDHLADGTSEQAWDAAGLDRLPTVTVCGERLVVLAAHPDDESLGAGGLLSVASRHGADIVVIVATDGEASHPASATHSPTQLATIRRREVRAAVSAVAPHARVHHLGLPDGRLAQFAPALDAAVLSVVGTQPARLVTPWHGDRHPDHEACAEAGVRLAARSAAVDHWQYPIWLWHWGSARGSDLPARLRRLDLEPVDLAAKRAALAAHVSQHAPLSGEPGDEAILPAPMLAHFDRPYECFVVGAAPAAEPAYFHALYEGAADPWGLGTRFYEQRKRELVLASLPRPRFRRVFEPGCATGLLTERLAERADEVLAWDVATVALEQASDRLRMLPATHCRVQRGQIPLDWPHGRFDLIVLSEVGYYCDDLELLVRRVLGSLSDDGVVLACHWRHRADDHPHSAADVHAALDRVLASDSHHEEADFLLDVWNRDGRSVAAHEGIV